MKQVGAFEAKTHFSHLLEEVENGEQIIITKHGRPIARLVPFSGRDSSDRQAAIDELKIFAKGNILGDVDWKTLRDEGRRF